MLSGECAARWVAPHCGAAERRDREDVPVERTTDTAHPRFVFVKGGTGKIDRGIAAVRAYDATMMMPKAAKPWIISIAAALSAAGGA